MKDLLEYLAQGLVEHPDQVRVKTVSEGDGATVLELSVADDDYGNVIGRGGRTASALRTVIKSARRTSAPARVPGHRRLLMPERAGGAEPPRGPAAPGRLRAGVVGRPHGLDGSFYVAQAAPELLSTGRTVWVGEHERAIERRAGTDDRPIVRVAGCGDRTGAEALRGTELRVARERGAAAR